VVDYFVGLDLGQAADYTALAVLEKTEALDAHPPRTIVRKYAVRHLERLALGTAYPAVVTRVLALVARPPLAACRLGVDLTGGGTAGREPAPPGPAARRRPADPDHGGPPSDPGRGGASRPQEGAGYHPAASPAGRSAEPTESTDFREFPAVSCTVKHWLCPR
jgi:hypothetical protein